MCILFFQAEDGIRGLVRSRGLGDVYKRQPDVPEGFGVDVSIHGREVAHAVDRNDPVVRALCAVSYTHLTLPTSDLV